MQLYWLRQVLKKSGHSMNALAARAKVSASTVTRFLDDSSSAVLQPRTVNRIARAYGVSPPLGSAEMGGEGEPHVYNPRDFELPSATLDDLLVYRITSDALCRAGFEQDDIVLIDIGLAPKAGQLVCAQVFGASGPGIETVFRYYEPPYLIAPSAAPALRRPLLIDNETVQIRGVVVRQLRSRNMA